MRPLRWFNAGGKYRPGLKGSEEADRAARTYAGVLFHSRKEARYAASLDQLRAAVDPKDRVVYVGHQVRFGLEVNGHLVTTWVADFVVSYGDGRQEVHEVKGFETEAWKIKRKLFLALHPGAILRVIK